MKFGGSFEVLLFILSWMVPWHSKTRNQMLCSREGSSVVRALFAAKWAPVFEKFRTTVPLECPFHQDRDIFHLYSKAKVNQRYAHWTCSLCGKSFMAESQLDYHLSNRHAEELTWNEDNICLADYCDIFRCDVHDAIQKMKTTNESSVTKSSISSTTALVRTGPRSLVPCVHFPWGAQYPSCTAAKYRGKETLLSPPSAPSVVFFHHQNVTLERSCNSTTKDYPNTTNSPSAGSRGIALLITRLKELQHSCAEQEMRRIRHKCEKLVHSCISSLLLNLTNQEFVNMEAELNRAVCWYLHCDRYWQEVWYHENPPSGGLILLIFLLCFFAAGFSISYCIVCILCDDSSVTTMEASLDISGTARVRSLKSYPQTNQPGTGLCSVVEEDFDCVLNCKHKLINANYDLIEDENSIV